MKVWWFKVRSKTD